MKITDKMRMDFISQNPRHVVYRRGIQSWPRTPIEWTARTGRYGRWSLHTNLRAAIDAAIIATRRKRA